MRNAESRHPMDWLSIAEKDWKRAEALRASGDAELAGFCLQQAVEKFLKAFLLARGSQIRRIHNLDALLDDAVQYDGSLEEFRGACQRITAYYVVERYPLMVPSGITEEDVESSISAVRALVQRLRAIVIPPEQP